MGHKSYTYLYNACVAPILDHGSEIWGIKNMNSCEHVHNRVIRYFLWVHKFAPTIAINAEMGWLKVPYRRTLNIVRFWNRLICMGEDRLPKLVFLYEYYNSKVWCKEVRHLMYMYGLRHEYDNMEHINLVQVKDI